MAQISYVPKFAAFDDTGAPLAGGLLYTYAAGTSTPKVTWSSATESVPNQNANPIVLDSRGEATVYANGSYKFVLKTAAGATIWTVDDIAIGGTVVTADIADGAVTTAKLADGVLSADATGRAKMADSFVTSAKLNSSGVALPNGSTATTQTASDNSTKVATTAYVSTQIQTDRKIVGRAYTTYGTYARITTVTPLDDTIPTNSEGDQVMSQAYTCAATTNRLRHTVTICGQSFATSYTIASVFSGSTCIAAQVTHGANASGQMGASTFVFETVPGVTTSVTYTVRVGVSVAGYFDINGYTGTGARVFGGVQVCSYVIEEIQP